MSGLYGDYCYEDYEEWDTIPVDIPQYESPHNSYPLLRSHLWQKVSQMMRRCARAHIPYVYCGSTALRLLGVETPEDLSGPGNAWDNAPPRATKQPKDALHVVVRTAGERKPLPGIRMHVWKGLAADSIQQFANGVQCLRPAAAWALHVVVRTAGERKPLPGIRMHVWKGLAADSIQQFANGVQCLRPAAAWASVAMDATMLQLIQIAESMERYGLATLADLRAFTGAHRFHGKRRCLRALAIARTDSASVKETELRVRLELRGLPACADCRHSQSIMWWRGRRMTRAQSTRWIWPLRNTVWGWNIRVTNTARMSGNTGATVTSSAHWRRWGGASSK